MMISYLFLCGMIGFCSAILTLMFQFKHLLNMLLSLEAMTLSLLVMLCSLSVFMGETYFVLVVITLGACEASLGLAVLVALIRSNGNDYVYSFNSSSC